jgi:hypothetical protein
MFSYTFCIDDLQAGLYNTLSTWLSNLLGFDNIDKPTIILTASIKYIRESILAIHNFPTNPHHYYKHNLTK